MDELRLKNVKSRFMEEVNERKKERRSRKVFFARVLLKGAFGSCLRTSNGSIGQIFNNLFQKRRFFRRFRG